MRSCFSCVSAVYCPTCLTRARASASFRFVYKDRTVFTHTFCILLPSYSTMSCPSNALTVGSRSRMDASAPPGNAAGTVASVRQPPDILTYCYDSRMVYVTPGETYDVRFFLTSLMPRPFPFTDRVIGRSISSEPSRLPWSPSRSSKTSSASGSVWRFASCSATSSRGERPRSGGRPGPSSSRRSRGSK